MLIKETQKPKDGGNTQMEFVTTLELSPGSEAVVEHQFEANRAWDLDKGRGILLASNSAVLTIIIATWIFSSGHISTSNPNRRQPTHEILVFKKIVKQKSLSLAFSFSFSPISSAFWNADAVTNLSFLCSLSSDLLKMTWFKTGQWHWTLHFLFLFLFLFSHCVDNFIYFVLRFR